MGDHNKGKLFFEKGILFCKKALTRQKGYDIMNKPSKNRGKSLDSKKEL